ncbi:shikimate kinase [Winogradskyella jejuensis]|uniref:Shikimate kinase n=1 Tax=Winogradskyella jejuensis TaxID=1089305 RepID=A0A1M5JGX3_9FLAO|nr:shikimate kinase [Winogradskyella jejuensis]SHG39771.1 shikimate kinase [Winogradskyella jejuensis]
MIIVLMGYMGSGKSTVGKKLAYILEYNFIDLDDLITEKESKSIADIFKTKGEIYFRKKETEYLKEVISSDSNTVLSLGGGTPCYGINLNIIKDSKNTKSFYLKTSLQELKKRLLPEMEKRPLISHLQGEDEIIEFLGKHLFERAPFYSQSDFSITTDGKSKMEIVEEIVLSLV